MVHKKHTLAKALFYGSIKFLLLMAAIVTVIIILFPALRQVRNDETKLVQPVSLAKIPVVKKLAAKPPVQLRKGEYIGRVMPWPKGEFPCTDADPLFGGRSVAHFTIGGKNYKDVAPDGKDCAFLKERWGRYRGRSVVFEFEQRSNLAGFYLEITSRRPPT
jgi:hypothetical protein